MSPWRSLTPVPSPSRGEGGDGADEPRSTLLPSWEKVDRPKGETDEGAMPPSTRCGETTQTPSASNRRLRPHGRPAGQRRRAMTTKCAPRTTLPSPLEGEGGPAKPGRMRGALAGHAMQRRGLSRPAHRISRLVEKAPLTPVPSPSRGEGCAGADKQQASLLPLREKVDRAEGPRRMRGTSLREHGMPDALQGQWSQAMSARLPLTPAPLPRGERGAQEPMSDGLPFSPRGTSSRLANRASGTIGGEKAMRAVLEWRWPERSGGRMRGLFALQHAMQRHPHA